MGVIGLSSGWRDAVEVSHPVGPLCQALFQAYVTGVTHKLIHRVEDSREETSVLEIGKLVEELKNRTNHLRPGLEPSFTVLEITQEKKRMKKRYQNAKMKKMKNHIKMPR